MSLTYCGNLVRQQDPDRFLLSLLAPAGGRRGLWALYAMNYEIARTREVVSEATTGLIRLAWWREAVEEIYAGKPPRRHEVVVALAEAIRIHNLPHEPFERLIAAREFDIEDRQPDTMEDFLHYCEETAAPLTHLALIICGEKEQEETIRAVSIRYAAIGLLRAFPYMLAQRRCYLPRSILKAYGISMTQLIDFGKKERLPEVVEETLSALAPVPPPRARYLKNMNKLSTLYERQMIKADYDLFSPTVQIPPPFKALRVII